MTEPIRLRHTREELALLHHCADPSDIKFCFAEIVTAKVSKYDSERYVVYKLRLVIPDNPGPDEVEIDTPGTPRYIEMARAIAEDHLQVYILMGHRADTDQDFISFLYCYPADAGRPLFADEEQSATTSSSSST